MWTSTSMAVPESVPCQRLATVPVAGTACAFKSPLFARSKRQRSTARTKTEIIWFLSRLWRAVRTGFARTGQAYF